MKSLFAVVILAFAALSAARPAAAQTGLVSWYRAEGNFLDAQGLNPGTASGSVTFVGGVVGQAFKFAGGSTDGIRIADSASLAITKSLTISAYVYVTALPLPTGIQGAIVFRGDQRAGFDPYVLGITPDSSVNFHVATNAGGVDTGADLSAGIAIGRWVAITATLDDATGAMSLYEDGYLVKRKFTSIRPFGALDSTQYPGVGIGNHSGQPYSSQHQPFTGMIDEVKIYNTVVPPQQPWRADVDQNAHIDIRDAVKELRIIAGLDPA